MKIKITNSIILYITRDRVIGYVVMFFSVNAAIYHAVFIDGAAGGFGSFLHFPTVVSVWVIGVAMTYMKKHALKDNELGKMLRKDMALSGWILFLLNAVLIGGGIYSEDNKELANMGPSLIRLVLCVQYGYVNGIILDAFLTRDVRCE
tara:strand:- start:148 stop:591 length:444 start_codon:yes stop_codon:yes gene_type:complete